VRRTAEILHRTLPGGRIIAEGTTAQARQNMHAHPAPGYPHRIQHARHSASCQTICLERIFAGNVEGQPDALSAFASRSADGKALSVVVINKGYEPLNGVRLSIKSAGRFTKGTTFRLSGSGADDRTPKWEELQASEVKDGVLAGLSLPGVSVTVVALQ
jgi:hypothetical protein